MDCTKTKHIITFDLVMLLRAGENVVPSNPKHALECLMQFGRNVFPTLCIAYRLLLTIGFSIASCERSFSKLKLIKTCIRSSMLQERLTSLALISIEREFLSADVKNKVVQIFSDRIAHMGKKNRKVYVSSSGVGKLFSRRAALAIQELAEGRIDHSKVGRKLHCYLRVAEGQ